VVWPFRDDGRPLARRGDRSRRASPPPSRSGSLAGRGGQRRHAVHRRRRRARSRGQAFEPGPVLPRFRGRVGSGERRRVKTPTVAIVGRPNVGKSTLFNRLIGRREAIVDDRPGVTRDRHFGAAEWNGRRFWLVDTGGMVPGAHDQLNRAIRTQVEAAVAASDVVLFLVDVDEGVHPADLEIAQYLRKARRPLILVANKADHLPADTRHLAFYELGLGDPFPISASIGTSSGDLLDQIVARLPAAAPTGEEAEIRVAVVGRPNVGKSSLVNRLLGAERLVVADEPGTTRDAIDTPLTWHGRTLVFIDTAGLRKRSKVDDDVEFYSTLRTSRAVEHAD